MFNTGNPVPSTDARDLSDNAESIDQITNGTATVTTRTGKVIKSIGPIVDTVDAAATQGLVDIAADVSTVDASATQAEIDILARVNEVGVIYDSPIRPWSASLLVSDLRAHKEGDEVYIPTKALPFTTGATFNTSDWMLLQGVTNGDIDNDISIVKVHQNVAAFKADTTEYPDGKTIHLNDRDADFIKITGTGTATGGRIIANTSVNQSIVLDVVDVANIHQFGAAAGEPDSSTRIQEAIDYAFSLVNKIDVVVPPASTPYRYSEIVNKGVLRGTGGVLKQLDNIAIDPAVIYYTLHNFSTVPSAWYDGAKYLDLIIDGNGANNPKANFLTFDVITAAGVGTDVKGCTITDSPDSGIMYTFIEQGECSGNTLDGGTDLGIYVNDFEAGALTDGAMVKGNIIKNYPNGGIGVKRGTSNVSIDGNTINNCGQGITHEAFGSGSGGNPSKTSIINNKLSKIGYPFRGTLQPEAAGEVGLSLIGFHNGLCANNTVNDVSGVGANITGDGFTFNDNKITASDPSNIIPTANGNIGVIVQSTALDGGVTDGILNDNTVTGFRDDGLDVRTVAALQIIGGYCCNIRKRADGRS